jgi:hypothetical protein
MYPEVQTHIIHIFVIEMLMAVCSTKEQGHMSEKEYEIKGSDAG